MTEALPVTDVSLEQIRAAGEGEGVCVGRPLDGVEIALIPLQHDGTPQGSLTTEPDCTGEIGLVGLSLGASLAMRCLTAGYAAASLIYPVQLFRLDDAGRMRCLAFSPDRANTLPSCKCANAPIGSSPTMPR